jgi:hypothetical protein
MTVSRNFVRFFVVVVLLFNEKNLEIHAASRIMFIFARYILRKVISIENKKITELLKV